MKRKGIILAGGTGSRLFPLTMATSKQLLPVYDKPMVYYPLSLLMLAGIREILIITTPKDNAAFKSVLGDGSQWGLSLSYAIQAKPNGIPEAYVIAEDFLAGHPSMLILGDNIIIGHALSKLLSHASGNSEGATIFEYRVRDPERFGVLERDANGSPLRIWEKPEQQISNYAIVGMYFLDENASTIAKTLTPSSRGETEIVDLLGHYLDKQTLDSKRLGRGFAWFDAGTHDSLLEAGNFVKSLCSKQGIQVGCPTEIAYRHNWIDSNTLMHEANQHKKTDYGRYLYELLEN